MSNRYGDTREQQGQPNERNLSAAGTYCISPSAATATHKATTINLQEIKVSGPDQVIIWRSEEMDEAHGSRIRCRLFTISCLAYGA